MAGMAASFSTNMSCRVAVGFKAASAFFVVKEPADKDTISNQI